MKRLAAVISLLLVTVLLASCTLAEVTVPLGQEFSLSVGHRAVISGEDLRIEFVDVVTDSRCPKDVVCIWAGEVKCLVELVSSGSAERVELTEPGLTGDTNRQAFKEYQLTFTVTPYPVSTKPIERGDYRLVLTVRKGA